MDTTLCLFCGATNVPTMRNSDGVKVAAPHDDEAHDNRPCFGSGK